MRNPVDDRKDALVDSLRMCGLYNDQLEKAQKYVNGEIAECDLGIAQKQAYFGVGTDERNAAIRKCFERLSRHGEKDLINRYFELLFQIFGLDISELYMRDFGLQQNVEKDKRVVLSTKGILEAKWRRSGIRENILAITEDRNVMKKALTYTKRQYPEVDFCILSTMFYGGKSDLLWDGLPVYEGAEEKKGLFQKLTNGLFGGKNVENHFETNEYVKRYPEEFQYYQSLAPEMADRVFGTQFGKMPEPHASAIRSYVTEGNPAAPVPEGLRNFLSKELLQDRAETILECAVLCYRLSPVLYRFMNLCMSTTHQPKILEMIFGSQKKDMKKEMLRWRADFRLQDTMLIDWLAEHYQNGKYGYANGVKRTDIVNLLSEMTKIAPDAYMEVLRSADNSKSEIMIEAAKKYPLSDLYRKHIAGEMAGKKSQYQENVIKQLTESADPTARSQAESYLRGACEIMDLYPHEGALKPKDSFHNVGRPLLSYIKVYGQDGFYERCVTYVGLIGSNYSLDTLCRVQGSGSHFDKDCAKALFAIFKKNGLDIAHRMTDTGIICDSFSYAAKDKKPVFLKIWEEEMAENRQEVLDAFPAGSVFVRSMGLELLAKDAETNKAEILKYLGDSSKQIKEELVDLLSGKKTWIPDLLDVLRSSKKSGEREVAAMALAKIPHIETYKEQLTEIAEKEKSRKVVDLIRTMLGEGKQSTEGAKADGTAAAGPMTAETYVKECHKGGRKRGLAWIYENPMPEVHFADKPEEAASEEYMQAVLISYAAMPVPGVNAEVKILTDGLEQNELHAFMMELYMRFMNAGAEAKKKWVLYAASIHGGSGIVPELKHQIDEWAANARGAIAAEAVKALSVNDSPTALLIVDGMARKYKFKQVRKAAQDAMAFAAAQLGLTVEELADRIVPDLGFDDKMERHFDYGTRSFTVKISPDLEIEVKDNTGKKIKTLPAVGKNDDEAKATAALNEFKELKKQMKTVVKNQAQRLDLAMSLNRRWTVENWKKLFVKNPVMHQFAISLIWGHYIDEKPAGIFRYMEDGTFNTVDEEEYELSEEGMIGLIHPLELDAESIAAWKEQLSDYEIKQSIEQLDRPVFTMTEEEKNKKRLERFGGKMLNGLSLAGKLTGMGRSKGTPEDGGVYSEFYRRDIDAGFVVELLFSGSYIGDENDEVTVFDAGFYTIADYDSRSYHYRSKREEKETTLAKVPGRYFSEIVYQLSKATASSEEMNENWRKEM